MSRLIWPATVKLGALLGALMLPCVAGAEIYGWVDPSGNVTYSNLPPPQSARVFDIIKETPLPTPEAQAAMDAAQRIRMKELEERLQQLERERPPVLAAAPPYPAPYAPSNAGYGPPPSYGPGCDSEYFDCDGWIGPAYYVAGLGPYPYRFHRGEFRNHNGFRGGLSNGRPFGPGPRSGGFRSTGGMAAGSRGR
jgi:hypothetical protein